MVNIDRQPYHGSHRFSNAGDDSGAPGDGGATEPPAAPPVAARPGTAASFGAPGDVRFRRAGTIGGVDDSLGFCWG